MNATRHDIVHLLRGSSGSAPAGARLLRQRARLIQSLNQAQSHKPRRRFVAWGSAFAICCASVAGAFYALSNAAPEATENLQLTAQLNNTSMSEGGWIQTDDSSKVLRFSEGSSIGIQQHSKARLGRVNSDHAELTLESGTLHADITKHTGVEWTIAAGPYRVQVVGTSFDVAWDFSKEHFRVDVSEGKVLVFGGDLPAAGVALTPGQSLQRTSERAADEPSPGLALLPQKDRAPEPTVVRKSESAMPESWQKLAREGSYDKALASARSIGLQRLLATLNADDLLLLANTARYAGDVSTATSAYVKLRERHPGHSAAHLAAFSLGRLASDVEGNPTSAARWFRTFLSESPRGDLAAGARARLMSTLLKLNDRSAAQAVAKDYLKYHPNGQHSATARSLVGASQHQ